jgi:hypothetical protein
MLCRRKLCPAEASLQSLQVRKQAGILTAQDMKIENKEVKSVKEHDFISLKDS